MLSFSLLSILSLVCIGIGTITGFFLTRYILNRSGTSILLDAEERSLQIVLEAQKISEKNASDKLHSIQEEWVKKKSHFEQDVQRETAKVQKMQKELRSKEDVLNKKKDALFKKEKSIENTEVNLNQQQHEINQKKTELEKTQAEQNERLVQISSLNVEEAKLSLLENLTKEVQKESSAFIAKIYEDEILSTNDRAKKMLLNAMEKLSDDKFSDNSVIFYTLKTDELKGKIIGKEGRNIKAFQNTTGVDIIVDDTPKSVLLSCFDPVRREIARMTLDKLLIEGVIHPSTIEAHYNHSVTEFNTMGIKVGEETLSGFGIKKTEPNLVQLIGMMKFSSTYGQNLLEHSKEVGQIAGTLAAELGLDSSLAYRAGLFHDIGKMVKNPEKSHAIEGMNLLKKLDEHPDVLNAVGAHHNEIPKTCVIADLVQFANTLSASRPNARAILSNDGEIKRLESFEDIAKKIHGVNRAYAIESGKEIRVIVDSVLIDDSDAVILAKEISDKISASATFSGKIKVSIIRESRTISYAQNKSA